MSVLIAIGLAYWFSSSYSTSQFFFTRCFWKVKCYMWNFGGEKKKIQLRENVSHLIPRDESMKIMQRIWINASSLIYIFLCPCLCFFSKRGWRCSECFIKKKKKHLQYKHNMKAFYLRYLDVIPLDIWNIHSRNTKFILVHLNCRLYAQWTWWD